MNITIESTARLPYGLIPSRGYTPEGLATIFSMWMEYLASNGEKFWSTNIIVTPDPDEARQVGHDYAIGKTYMLSFREIRSVLVQSTAK